MRSHIIYLLCKLKAYECKFISVSLFYLFLWNVLFQEAPTSRIHQPRTAAATQTLLSDHLNQHSATLRKKNSSLLPVVPAAVPVATCISKAGEDGIVQVTTMGLKRFWRRVGVTRLTSSVPPDSSESDHMTVVPTLPQPHQPVVGLQRLPTILAPSLVARLLHAGQRSRVEFVWPCPNGGAGSIRNRSAVFDVRQHSSLSPRFVLYGTNDDDDHDRDDIYIERSDKQEFCRMSALNYRNFSLSDYWPFDTAIPSRCRLMSNAEDRWQRALFNSIYWFIYTKPHCQPIPVPAA